MSVSLRSILNGGTIEKLIADFHARDLPTELYPTFRVPPQSYIKFTEELPPLPFDLRTMRPGYKEEASFFVMQAHKNWVVLSETLNGLSEDAVVLDLGSYPFALPISLRLYSKFKGRIIASRIQDIGQVGETWLAEQGIELCEVNLDPHVRVEDTEALTCTIPLADKSADVIVLSHVIEHLYHPMNILREAKRVLKENGRLLIFTDNGLGLHLLNTVIGGGDYVHEPVEGTAAMQIHSWRGHVRFFSSHDIEVMTGAAGFQKVKTEFVNFFYDNFSSRYFSSPNPRLGGWQIDLLTKYPNYRNDILYVCR